MILHRHWKNSKQRNKDASWLTLDRIQSLLCFVTSTQSLLSLSLAFSSDSTDDFFDGIYWQSLMRTRKWGFFWKLVPPLWCEEELRPEWFANWFQCQPWFWLRMMECNANKLGCRMWILSFVENTSQDTTKTTELLSEMKTWNLGWQLQPLSVDISESVKFMWVLLTKEPPLSLRRVQLANGLLKPKQKSCQFRCNYHCFGNPIRSFVSNWANLQQFPIWAILPNPMNWHGNSQPKNTSHFLCRAGLILLVNRNFFAHFNILEQALLKKWREMEAVFFWRF